MLDNGSMSDIHPFAEHWARILDNISYLPSKLGMLLIVYVT